MDFRFKQFSLLLLIIFFCVIRNEVSANGIPGLINVVYPRIISKNIPFSLKVYFPSQNSYGSLWSDSLHYVIRSPLVSPPLQTGVISPYPNFLSQSFAIKDEYLPGKLSGSYGKPLAIPIDNILFPSNLAPPYGNIPIEITIGNMNATEVLRFSLDKERKIKPSGGQNNQKRDYLFRDGSTVYGIPGWLAILPSILTVSFAILFRQNILALFLGTWLGATFLYGYNPIVALLRLLDTTIISALADPGHASIIYFCLCIGGMIAVIERGGGAVGMARLVTRIASTRLKGQLATYMIGVLTFFDDYSSCLVGGSTMRDITGNQKTSREKSSFIVDTNAAAIPSLVPFSSWIGVELTFIGIQLGVIGRDPSEAYDTFLKTIPYGFYPLLILVFSLGSILSQRDFGPMLKAERRAYQTGRLVRDGGVPLSASEAEEAAITPKPDKPARWWNAAIPFLVVVVVIIGGMFLEGWIVQHEKADSFLKESIVARSNGLFELAKSLERQVGEFGLNVRDCFASGSPIHGLLWASFLGSAVAIFLVVSQKILSLSEAMDAWLNGTKTMLYALLILIHAWALGIVCEELQTSAFIANALQDYTPAGLLPTVVFLLGAFVSFSTGSAWGTMSILFPLMVPLSHSLAPGNETLLLGTISGILSGSVWGNHVSPIADSCVMASMACGSDHNDHVRTQAVYAISVGFISILFGTLPVGFGIFPCYIGLILGMFMALLLLFSFGRRVDSPVPWNIDDLSAYEKLNVYNDDYPFVYFFERYCPWLVNGFCVLARLPPFSWISSLFSHQESHKNLSKPSNSVFNSTSV